jgi:hypothetical protein
MPALPLPASLSAARLVLEMLLYSGYSAAVSDHEQVCPGLHPGFLWPADIGFHSYERIAGDA